MPARKGHLFVIACCLILLSALPVAGQTPEYRNNRVDLLGEPLPPRVLARLATMRPRHEGGAETLAWSPDGKLLATAGGDGKVKVWDAATGRELERFKDQVRGQVVAFSADGKELLAAGTDRSLKGWDVALGTLLRQQVVNPDEVKDSFSPKVAAFSPDLAWLALTDRGNQAELREVNTGKQLLRLSQEQALAGIAVSPDRKTLASTAVARGVVTLWDARTGKSLRQLQGGEERFTAIQFAPGGKILAAAARNQVWLWDPDSGKELRRIAEAGGRLAFSPDGQTLATAGEGSLRLWNVNTGQERGRCEGVSGWVYALAFAADGKRLGAVRSDAAVGVWDVATGKSLLGFDGHRGPVTCLAFSPDGKELASGSGGQDAALLFWDLATGKPRLHLARNQEYVGCMAWSPDGKYLATADNPYFAFDAQAPISLWDRGDGRLVRKWVGQPKGVFSLGFSGDGKFLLSAGAEGAALWDPASDKRLHLLRGTEFRRIAHFSPDGKTVLVAGREGEVLLWRAGTNQPPLAFGPAPGEQEVRLIDQAAWLPDGKTFETVERLRLKDQGRDRCEVRFWDAATGQRLRLFPLPVAHREGPRIYALSPDGKTLAATEGSYDQAGIIQLWDIGSGQRLLALRGHNGPIEALAFGLDGATLASGSRDTAVLLWDLTGARLEALWTELTSGLEENAQALKRLGTPGKAVPLLKQRLSWAAEQEARIDHLIKELDDDNFEVREKASRALAELGEVAVSGMRRALEGNPSAEARNRLEQVLEKMQSARDGAEHSPSRGMLALSLLEELGTAGARQALEELAGARAESRVRREARLVLERLRQSKENPLRKRP